MARRVVAGQRLVVASHNQGKVVEIEALLKPFGVATIGAALLGLPEPEETGASFEENAETLAGFPFYPRFRTRNAEPETRN